MKDLGKATYFLGVNLINDNDKILIHQTDFTLKLLEKFGLNDCKSVTTPIDVSNKLVASTESDSLVDIQKYQSAVGALLYLSTRTRPDISFAVGNVAKFSSKPCENHWTAVKRIFRYLKGTQNLGISYCKSVTNPCLGYSDADWAGDLTDRKSTSGYCFSICNGLVSWRSTKQTSVALSTAEAEYIALSGAAQEAAWLHKLLRELGFPVEGPITIYEDNQSAICLSKSNRNHPKTKHIDIKYNYIRSVINQNIVEVEYCPTSEMLADIFTKGMTSDKFVKLRNLLGLVFV